MIAHFAFYFSQLKFKRGNSLFHSFWTLTSNNSWSKWANRIWSDNGKITKNILNAKRILFCEWNEIYPKNSHLVLSANSRVPQWGFVITRANWKKGSANSNKSNKFPEFKENQFTCMNLQFYSEIEYSGRRK